MSSSIEKHHNEAFVGDDGTGLPSSEQTSSTATSTPEPQERLNWPTKNETDGAQTNGTQMRRNITYLNIGMPNGKCHLEMGKSMDDRLSLHEISLEHDTEKLHSRQRGSKGHFSIVWQDLDYVVESKWWKLAKQRKPILSSMSGVIRSGELSAILGPSGAGKSTLIDCLLGKRSNGLRGKTRVVFDDLTIEQERRRKRPLRIATIPQEDHLLDTLTVTETFMFASKIKNAHLSYEEEDNLAMELELDDGLAQEGDKTSSGVKVNDSRSGKVARRSSKRPFNHFANVQRVIKQLKLSSCATQKCGKLSGGQYKRVSIGQELLSRPDIMILDEPTSGLDSVTCFQTINALRQLIESSPYPMAIVSTIHQPDVEVFNLFHRAYVLAPGGRPVYEGPTSGIFDAVQRAVNSVDARRELQSKQLGLLAGATTKDHASPLANLRAQLRERSVNPARLIIEVAANEHGYEITNALNEQQRAQSKLLFAVDPLYPSSVDLPELLKPLHHSTETSHGPTGGSLASSCQELVSNSTTEMSPSCSGTCSPTSDAGSAPTPAPAPVPQPPSFSYEAHQPNQRKPELDKLLDLTSANMKQRRSVGTYLRHILYHTQRSWLTIVRDPMLFSVQVALHVLVPLLISYAFQGRSGEACPHIGPLDVIDEAYREGNVLDDLNEELRNAFENLGYMFFQIYVIIFAAVCVTSLTYPLAMHVLLKEYRNGWYSMSSYFLGRTLADLPVPIFNGTIAMAISYHLTGQPLSPYMWRFASVATLVVLATIVAQTQGLMFGAMLMNAPQAAVFVAPASTAPLVVVSGFLIRIRSLPALLAFLSKFSYFTYLLEGFIVSRYGFNRCPCDEGDFLIEQSRRVPQQAEGIIDIWVDTFKTDYPQSNSSRNVNLIGKLVDTISRAKTFGHEMTQCSQVKPFTMLEYELDDSHLQVCFAALVAMLVAFRWLTYATLVWKINSSI